LNEYRSNDRCSRPIASTGRHLKKPLLQRKLAYLSHATVSASEKRGHDPRNKLKEGKERAVEVLEEFGGLEDAINRTQDALTQDGRTKGRIVMMVFVRNGDRRENWNCHGRLKSRSAIEMLQGVLCRAHVGDDGGFAIAAAAWHALHLARNPRRDRASTPSPL
jgi:hypothetical protein